MRLTSPSRRAAGLLAVTAIGLSTAVLSVTGIASAATTTQTFSTDPAANVDHAGASQITMAGSCTVDWVLDGAAGGSSDTSGTPGAGVSGSRVATSTTAADGDVFQLYAGNQGGDADGTVPQVGTGGTNASGVANTAGLDGVETLDPNNSAVVLTYGGGGGSASVVTGANGFVVSAKGGDGADSPSTGGGTDSAAATASPVTGAGVISGSYTCTTVDPVVTAPSAPVISSYVETGDTTAKLRFTPGAQGTAVPSSWQYQLDGGSWTTFTPGFTNNDDLTATLTGLTNLQTYSVALRAVSADGNGAASAPVKVTPYRMVAAPAGVTASVGLTALRISWTPPADASGIVGYEAFAIPAGAQSSADVVLCTTASATATSCTVAVKAGVSYEFGVRGIDAGGNLGAGVFGEKATVVVPASAIPAALPKADGVLVSDDADAKIVAGEKITLSGTGYLPGSTVELIIYSDPVKLGEVTVLADGTFTATVTVPKDLTDGVHHLVASGVDANGNVRNLVVEVTVSGGTAVLAFTGFSPLPFIGAGVLALGAGGGLLVASRRRAQ
ncbi:MULTISPECIES: Ig-like domain-containing protein [unclassified Modestobacter]|uniref:Ig-like domain-containing protein n=1 Tax=unclassified Modestobacter TaxID=2643866 RepID=UPI0022AAA930|nr:MULTISPECIES: Ig-like domain-containing protein [unclassified Modestobacter]MCZ2825655.1 Ig-like domain-containing protein [Modestobacter sp. VKM Ac-2981]MCZ2853280.1 Ig-like domain-containing protein [Modestobacter sp. VKM Ac-2982]